MRNEALWNSLIRKYGEKGLRVNVRFTAISWIIWILVITIVFSLSLMGKVLEKSPTALTIYAVVVGLINFLIGIMYYGIYPTGAKFIMVYEDKIIISTRTDADGPGFVTISRKEYWVDAIARDMEVRDPEKHKIYTIIFNKPIRGCMHVRLLPEMYISEKELMKLVEILKPRRALPNGFYFPRVYAIFKVVCGERHSELAEKLLRNFESEVKEYGFHKVCAVMNALKSLCLAKRINDAVFLAESIVSGRVFKFVNLIDEDSYLKWFYDSAFLENASRAYDFVDNLVKFCGYGIAAIIVAVPCIGGFASILGFEAISRELLLMAYVCSLLIVYFFSLATNLYPVYWSRVSIKCGMRCEVIYLTFAAFIPFVLALPSMFFAFEAVKYFWIFLVGSAIFLPPIIIALLVMCGYFQYKVGLKHAEILLKALGRSS